MRATNRKFPIEDLEIPQPDVVDVRLAFKLFCGCRPFPGCRCHRLELSFPLHLFETTSPPTPPSPCLFVQWPVASTDFEWGEVDTADLLMIWDFCVSYGEVLALYPFRLTDLRVSLDTSEVRRRRR